MKACPHQLPSGCEVVFTARLLALGGERPGYAHIGVIQSAAERGYDIVGIARLVDGRGGRWGACGRPTRRDSPTGPNLTRRTILRCWIVYWHDRHPAERKILDAVRGIAERSPSSSCRSYTRWPPTYWPASRCGSAPTPIDAAIERVHRHATRGDRRSRPDACWPTAES